MPVGVWLNHSSEYLILDCIGMIGDNECMKYLLVVEFLGVRSVVVYAAMSDAVRAGSALMAGYSETDAVRIARIIPVKA